MCMPLHWGEGKGEKWNESCHGDLELLIPHPDHKEGLVFGRVMDLPWASHSRGAQQDQSVQCAHSGSSWGRGPWPFFPVWKSNWPPPPPVSAENLCEAMEAVTHSSLLSGEMRHSNRFDTPLFSYQATFLIPPGLTVLSLSLSLSQFLSPSLCLSFNLLKSPVLNYCWNVSNSQHQDHMTECMGVCFLILPKREKWKWLAGFWHNDQTKKIFIPHPSNK